MELLQLQYFLQLANLQHVTKTARQLHVSQPSLSATIKKLEAELGAPLFIRKGRNIVLSPYGEAFKQYAEEAFLSLENGRQAVARLRREERQESQNPCCEARSCSCCRRKVQRRQDNPLPRAPRQ